MAATARIDAIEWLLASAMDMTPVEFDVLIGEAVAMNKELAKAAGIKPQ